MCESGILLVDKPQGVTSHDVVAAVRAALHTRHVGHAGTLDPMATGLLVIGFGKATRLLRYMVGHDKQYEATIRLGFATDTDDADGQAIIHHASQCDQRATELENITQEGLQALVNELFVGTIEQLPSAYSSVRVHGKHAYELARKGETPQLATRSITIHEFEILNVQHHATALHLALSSGNDEPNLENNPDVGSASPGVLPGASPVSETLPKTPVPASQTHRDACTTNISVVDVAVRVHCSSGTYIRALARDLGDRLGLGGHLIALRRTRVGNFLVNTCDTLHESDSHDNGAHRVATVKVVPRERKDKTTGELKVRNAAVMVEDRATLLGYALSPADAASNIMKTLLVSRQEAQDLAHGRSVAQHIDGTTAALYCAREPDRGANNQANNVHLLPSDNPMLCAILVPGGEGTAQPQTVFSANFCE